jgi:hypothetical protein
LLSSDYGNPRLILAIEDMKAIKANIREGHNSLPSEIVQGGKNLYFFIYMMTTMH